MRSQASDDQGYQQADREPMGNCREVVFELLQSGAVIHVGGGKGVSALSGAFSKLKRSKLKIVTMNIENAYYSWIYQEFSNVKTVFYHFYVIKLMNDKFDKVRRWITAKLNITQQKLLKGLRFIFQKNNENLPEDAKIILRNMREEFQELGDAYMFKEKRLCGHLFKSPNILPCENRFSSLDKARRGNEHSWIKNNGKDASG